MTFSSLFWPMAILLGSAGLAYLCLNLLLWRGLQKLGKSQKAAGSIQTLSGAGQAAHGVTHGAVESPLVTVLIAARNEAGRIEKCLDCLLHQDYPRDRLQIVVAEDRSTDATPAILRSYEARFPALIASVTVTETNPYMSPKKYALSLAMGLAKGDIILTTDADCVLPTDWISCIIAEFSPETGMVLGLTTYYPVSTARSKWPVLSGIWQGTQSLEFFSHSVAASALVALDFPVNGNANNMAYRRVAYEQAQGVLEHGHIVSGDDDFLIQSIHKAGRWKIRYATRLGARVETEPPETLRQFWEQRKRWAGKCSLYQPKQTAFLGGIFAYYATIPICLVLGCYYRPFLWAGLLNFGLKTLMEYIVMRRAAILFSKRHLLQYFPWAALLHIPLILAAVPAGSFGQFTWKGQTVRRTLPRNPETQPKPAAHQPASKSP